jgi:hypothetical protein
MYRAVAGMKADCPILGWSNIGTDLNIHIATEPLSELEVVSPTKMFSVIGLTLRVSDIADINFHTVGATYADKYTQAIRTRNVARPQTMTLPFVLCDVWSTVLT